MKSTIVHRAILFCALSSIGSAQSFYKESPLFTTAPPEKQSVTTIGNFGPVGIAIDLHQPAFTMWVGDIAPKSGNVDIAPGSPAEVAGLKKDWFKSDFKVASADWKKGLPPFGQYKGKLEDNHSSGRNLWTEKPRTLWEHEVLLVRGAWQFPALKPGHAYRLRVARGQGVGAGDGFKVFVNGKEIVEVKDGLGRRAGDVLRGGYITSEFTEDFAKGPVTVAALTFLRYGDRAIVTMPPEPQGIFSMWLEERKLPVLDAATFARAATMAPMLNTAWQDAHDPDSEEEPTEDLRFHYDGKFISNASINGKWSAIATVDAVESFDPKSKQSLVKPLFKDLELKEGGGTHSPNYIWSGDTLMDLDLKQALKMKLQAVGGNEYLFIEAGGFGPKNPVGWKSQWMVLKH